MPNRLLVMIKAFKYRGDRVRLLLMLTAGYAAFNIVNHYATQALYLETGAHLVHLPSGIRMVIVLIAGGLGAVAISVATFPYAYFVLFEDNLELSTVVSLTTSLIPLTTLLFVRRFIQWQADFADMSLRKLAIISITYAIANATVQQFVYHSFEVAERPLNAWLVMFTGDIVGILIVLYCLRLIGKALKKQNKL